MSTRALRSGEKRALALLGLPTAALALAITTVTTYLPVVARSFLGSTTVIGLLIAIEGIMALWVPLVAGSWSDRLRTPIGGRLPFLVAATPVAAAALVVMGFADGAAMVAASAAIFFAAYFVAYEPYRALYPDLIDEEVAGRAQSTQAVWRGIGTGVALVGGGLLLSIGTPVPFVVAAVALVACLVAFVEVARRRGTSERAQGDRDERVTPRVLLELLRDNPGLREFLAANALWEASLGALKTFAFLFVTVGVGLSKPEAAGIIGAVALVVLAAAPLSGRLADRVGGTRVMAWTLPVYGLGLLVPAFTQSPAICVPLLVVAGFGGGMVMTLPYALLQPLMPEERHGALTGFYSVSRGIGTALGPLLAGAAIQVLASPFSSTQGYGAMWLVVGGTILASIWPLRALHRRCEGA